MRMNLRELVLDFAYYLNSYLKELELEDFSEHYRNVYDLIKDLQRITKECIKLIVNKDTTEDKIRFISNLLLYISVDILGNIPSIIDIKKIPVEVLDLLDDILKFYEENYSEFKKLRIIVKPSYVYTYACWYGLTMELNKMLDRLNIEPISKSYHMILFPVPLSDNVLLHTIFLHELGHVIEKELNMTDNILDKTQIKFNEILVNELIKIKYQSEELKAREDEIKSEVLEQLLRIIKNWIGELLADAIAVNLIGPAYLFALTEFIFTIGDIPNEKRLYEEHPPTPIRLKLILDCLNQGNYINPLHNFKSVRETINYLNQIANKAYSIDDLDEFVNSIEEKLKLQILMESIKLLHNNIIEEVKSTIKPYYDSSTLIRELNELVDRIKTLIPPNEIINANNAEIVIPHIASIVNAGYIYKIEYINEFYNLLNLKTEDEKFSGKITLNKLLAKGLELRNVVKTVKEKSLK